MAEPSKERIAAALALAEATAEWANIQEPASGENRVRCWIERMQPALTAYRATAPKLRTRAEVDAEIVAQVRDYFGGGPKSNGALGEQYALIQELCREETAPEQEPPPSKECDWCQDSSRPPLHRNRTPERLEWVCRRCLEERWKPGEPELQDPPPCGCEEVEALRQRIAKTRLFVQQSPKIRWGLAAEILRVLNGEA